MHPHLKAAHVNMHSGACSQQNPCTLLHYVNWESSYQGRQSPIEGKACCAGPAAMIGCIQNGL